MTDRSRHQHLASLLPSERARLKKAGDPGQWVLYPLHARLHFDIQLEDYNIEEDAENASSENYELAQRLLLDPSSTLGLEKKAKIEISKLLGARIKDEGRGNQELKCSVPVKSYEDLERMWHKIASLPGGEDDIDIGVPYTMVSGFTFYPQGEKMASRGALFSNNSPNGEIGDWLDAMKNSKYARFHEGPKGEKEFQAWMKKQPKEVQEDWDKYNEENKDKFKTAEEAPEKEDEEAMFAKGEDVPLEELPDELQDNVKNPPPEVQKLKDELQKKSSGEEALMEKEDPSLLPVELIQLRAAEGRRERLTWGTGVSKEAGAGLYGYTKQIQSDVEASIRKIQKRSFVIAKQALKKDPHVGEFLQAHSKRARSVSAKLILNAIKELSKGTPVPKRAATEKIAKGLYGHPTKTARLGLAACTEFQAYSGEIAASLHERRLASYEKITGFLSQHSKTARCVFSKYILGCFPELPGAATVKPPKKKAGFDPAEIGEDVGGPLELTDSNEPWMEDHFTQEEFQALGGKQEAGELSDGKADLRLAASRILWKAGDTLTVGPVGPALQSTYPASNWLKEKMDVEALEEGASQGLDVFDVKTPDGKEEAIYGFQVVKKTAPKKASQLVAPLKKAFTPPEGVRGWIEWVEE